MSIDAYIGEIKLVAFRSIPGGWAACNGQLLAIEQHKNLFQLMGTMYGGDGKMTFALPNLNGRFPLGAGTGFLLGQTGGQFSTPLAIKHLPEYQYTIEKQSVSASLTLQASSAIGDTSDPTGAVWANASDGLSTTLQSFTQDTSQLADMKTMPVQVAMPEQKTQKVGGNQPIDITNPFVTVQYIICLYGIYPSEY